MLIIIQVTTFQEDKSTTSSGSTTTSSPAITSENAKHYDKLQADSTSVVDSLKTARGSCCGLDIERDDEESRKTIFGAFESYSTATIKVYKTLNSTVTAFDKNGKSFAVAQGVIMDVRKIIVDSFNVCLVVDVPKMNYEKAKKDAEEILETMENGRETFGIPFPIDEILVEQRGKCRLQIIHIFA